VKQRPHERLSAELKRQKLTTRLLSDAERAERAIELAVIVNEIIQIEQEKILLENQYLKLRQELDEELSKQLMRRKVLLGAVLYNYEEVEAIEEGKLVQALVDAK
jgi:hypothetical protein